MDIPLMEGFLTRSTSNIKNSELVFVACWGECLRRTAHLRIFSDENQGHQKKPETSILIESILEIHNVKEKKFRGFEITQLDGTKSKFVSANVLLVKKWTEALLVVMAKFGKVSNAFISDGDRIFPVKLSMNQSAREAGFHPENNLILTDAGLVLQGKESGHNKVCAFWDYENIRKYGSDGSLFTIESGRSTSTGHGIWNMKTKMCDSISALVDEKINSRLEKTTGNQQQTKSINDTKCESSDQGADAIYEPVEAPRSVKSAPLPPLPPRRDYPGQPEQEDYYSNIENRLQIIKASSGLCPDNEESYLYPTK